MRRTKANLQRQSNGEPDKFADEENIETEREQRFKEVDGETSTDGLGAGYTNDAEFERSIQTADGPLAGDQSDPPTSAEEVERAGKSKREKKRMAKRGEIDRDAGSHLAARSPKAI